MSNIFSLNQFDSIGLGGINASSAPPSYYDFSSWLSGQIYAENKGSVAAALAIDSINGISSDSDLNFGFGIVSSFVTNRAANYITNIPAVDLFNTGYSITSSIQLTNAAVALGLVEPFGATDFLRNAVSILSTDPKVSLGLNLIEKLTDINISSIDYGKDFQEIRSIVIANDPNVTGLSYAEMGALNVQARSEAADMLQQSILNDIYTGTGSRSEDFIEEGDGFAISIGYIDDPFLNPQNPWNNGGVIQDTRGISFDIGGGGSVYNDLPSQVVLV